MSKRFVKDVIRAGRFFIPHMNAWLDVDAARIDQWVSQFSRMSAGGVNVPLTTDHAQTADAVRGKVARLFRDGDVLKMECEVFDDDTESLLARCPHVSLELEKNFADGNGATYPEAVTAVTITPKPVVPDQEPFQKIAASRTLLSQSFRFQVKLSLNSDPAGGENEPTLPRARGLLGELLGVAMEEYGDESAVGEFVARIQDGDLQAVLWNAITQRLGIDDPSSMAPGKTNGEIRAVVLDELRKLWDSNPPAPTDDLANIFGESDDPAPGTTVALCRQWDRQHDPVAHMRAVAHSNYINRRASKVFHR